MRKHSEEFKSKINIIGRELDSIITYGSKQENFANLYDTNNQSNNIKPNINIIGRKITYDISQFTFFDINYILETYLLDYFVNIISYNGEAIVFTNYYELKHVIDDLKMLEIENDNLTFEDLSREESLAYLCVVNYNTNKILILFDIENRITYKDTFTLTQNLELNEEANYHVYPQYLKAFSIEVPNVLSNEQLNAVTPVLQSVLLKSVMKELDIDSNVDIPIGTIINYKFGVLLDSGDYEYLDYGNYQIYSSEKQEDNNAYNIVAYDKMLNSMVEYTKLKKENVKFPISVRDYITYLCEDIGLEFKNKEDEFANYNRMIESDLYAGLGYTYRDIFDELAQVTASNIIINENDEVEIKYITSTGEIETTSSNNNNIIEADNIPKQNARSLIVYGNSFQETRSGKNLYKYKDLFKVNNATKMGDIENGYWYKGNDSEASSLDFSKGWLFLDFDMQPDVKYYISMDIEQITEGYSNSISFSGEKDQSVNNVVQLSKVKKRYQISYSFSQEQKILIKLNSNEVKISNIQIELNEFTDYEPYGAMPSPEFPSEIECVQGNLQLVDTGKNLYNYKDTRAISPGIITDDEGWITISYDNSKGSGTIYRNYYTHNLNLRTNTNYNVIVEIKDVSGNASIHFVGTSGAAGQFIRGYSYKFTSLTNTHIVQKVYLTRDSFDNADDLGLRTFASFQAGGSGSITFRLSVLEDTSITPEEFVYEPYQKTETYVDIGNNKLCKINDVADEHDIVSGKGIKRIGKEIINGTSLTTINGLKALIYTPKIKKKQSGINGGYCDRVFFNQTNRVTNTFYENPSNFVFIGTADDTLETLKEKFDGAILYYVLETPQEFTTEPVNIQLRKGYNKIEIKDKNELINKLDLTYQLDDDTINEEYLKDVNIKFGEKYGPINSIVLSRSAGADNIYLQDEQSVADNGLCELKISDNQIMNFNDRSDYLPDILNKLNGLEYYINDFSSTGICYYEIADRYNVKVFDNTYPCVMFNDEIDVSQGLAENIYTDLPEQAETDYTKADKTDRKINQTYIIVDKQNQTIESVINQVGEQGEKITQNEQTIDGFKQTVSDLQKTVEESGFITEEVLNSAIEQSAGKIEASVNDKITDSEGNIKKDVTGQLALYIKKGATNDVVSAFNLATDEVTIDSKNFKLAANGNITATGGKIGGWTIGSDRLSITNGNYNIMLMNASNNSKDVLIVREGTNTYPFYLRGDGTLQATKATIKGNITATGGNIGGFKITGNSFETDLSYTFPNITESDLDKMKQYMEGKTTLTDSEFQKYDLNADGEISSADLLMGRLLILGNMPKNVTGKFKINTNDPRKTITMTSNTKWFNTTLGFLGGLSTSLGDFDTVNCNDLTCSSITCNSISMLININHFKLIWDDKNHYVEVLGLGKAWGIDIWDSDKRLKKNIEDNDYKALEKILAIKHRKFDYKTGGHIENGYIADELEEIDPDFVFEVGEDKTKQPKVNTLIPAITKAIQEQQEMINKLNEEIINLKSELENYRKEVNSNEK